MEPPKALISSQEENCKVSRSAAKRIAENEVRQTENWFECKQCDRRFNNSSFLQNHALFHTDEKPFRCDCCEKGFARKQYLVKHIRTHAGDKSFYCQHCNKQFIHLSYLRYHVIRIHTQDKPFKCKQCDKKFGTSSHLKRHFKIQTGEKLFQCEHCDKKFGMSSVLKRHVKIHTGEKSYHCQHCNKQFIDLSNLRDHVNRIHTPDKPFKCLGIRKCDQLYDCKDLEGALCDTKTGTCNCKSPKVATKDRTKCVEPLKPGKKCNQNSVTYSGTFAVTINCLLILVTLFFSVIEIT